MNSIKKRTLNEIRQTKDSVYENKKSKTPKPCKTSMTLEAEKFIDKNYDSLRSRLTSSEFKDVIDALVRYKENY
jgi:hypothetical protein